MDILGYMHWVNSDQHPHLIFFQPKIFNIEYSIIENNVLSYLKKKDFREVSEISVPDLYDGMGIISPVDKMPRELFV